MFSSIAAISIALFLGMWTLCPARYRRALALSLAAVLFVIALASPFLYIAPAYARPAMLSKDEITSISHPLYIRFGEGVELVGYDLDKKRVQPGEEIEITLYWRALAPVDTNYSIYIHLLDREHRSVAQRDTYPGGGTMPTTLWKPGNAFADPYRITVPRGVKTPQLLWIHVGLYDLRTMTPLAATDPHGQPTSTLIGRIKVSSPEPVAVSVPNPVHFNLGNQVALIGYELDKVEVQAGETLPLTLYWEAMAPLSHDYTVFTQVLGPGNEKIGQKDNQPQGGDYPTSFWDVGEIVPDAYEIQLDPEAPAGEYRLVVGMYLLETGERLPVLDEQGNVVDGMIELVCIRVR